MSPRAILALLFVVLLAAPAPCENQKVKNLKVKTQKAVEKAAQTVMEPIRDPKAAFSTWFDFDPKIQSGEKANFNILPLFVSSPERGMGFGLKFAQESLVKKNDVTNIQIIHTLKNKDAYRLKYDFSPGALGGIGGEFEAVYENYGQFYYGIGNQTGEENESEYNPQYTDIRLPLLYGINDRVSLGLALNYENWSITDVGDKGVLKRDLPGLEGKDGSRLYTTSLLLRWDSRNSKTNPSRGVFLESDFEYSKKLLGSEADFTRTTLEARGFHPLDRDEEQIVALRAFVDYKGGNVPFYHLPQLGGIFFNRGLIEGRFRDNLSICGNIEYRVRIYQRLHWAFFVDAGNVFHDFHAASYRRTKFTGGTGMRYYVPPGNLLLARVDAGYSTEGLNLYLTFDHPF